MSERVVVALPGSDRFAAALVRQLAARQAPLESRRFPDGESYFRMPAPDAVKGASVALVACLREPDPNALGLWFAADLLRDLGAARVDLVAPYLPYMRQDTRFHPGEALTSRTFARFVSQAFDSLVTVDPHLHRYASLADVYTVPATAVASAPAIARWIMANVPDALLVGPDEESEQWAGEIARLAGCPAIVLRKQRAGDRDVQVSVPEPGEHAARTPVLVDDIISSAQTMAVAAKCIHEVFGKPPACVGVHAIFAPGAAEALQDAGVRTVVTTNTLPHATNAIDVTAEVARAYLGSL